MDRGKETAEEYANRQERIRLAFYLDIRNGVRAGQALARLDAAVARLK
jgi:hypothetical protein